MLRLPLTLLYVLFRYLSCQWRCCMFGFRTIRRSVRNGVLCILMVAVLHILGKILTVVLPEDDVERSSAIQRRHLIRQCDNITRPYLHGIKYSVNGDWQVLREGGQEVMAHSAIVDDRPIVGSPPQVRIMAIARIAKPQLFCHLWYDGQSKPIVTGVQVTAIGRGNTIKHVRFGQYMYSCALSTSSPVPTHVSIAANRCGTSTIVLPVIQPEPYKHEFGLCAAISFGSLNVAHFSEWMELHLMLGVGEINIYNATLSETMKPVFSYYENKGVLRVHQMAPPVEQLDEKAAKLGSHASLNDCMYRNMYKYKLIVVVDFDEVIVPRQHANYSELIRFVDKSKNLTEHWWSYSFRNAYFFRELTAAPSSTELLMTSRYITRVKPSRFLFGTKSFVDPRRCLATFNHYCHARFPETPREFTMDIPTTLAMSHHYRDCNFGRKTCQRYYNQKTKDDYMFKYREELLVRVQQVLKHTGYRNG